MKRIICHGDSLTEGSDIEAAFRWPALLQNSLAVEVINTGVGAEKEIPVLDFHQEFIDDNENIKSHYFLEDGVHPDRKGHRRMAEAAVIKLKEWFLL